MSRRANKIASQAETADLVSALSEAAGSFPRRHLFMRHVELLQRFSRMKKILSTPPPVATSSSGLEFRSFSPTGGVEFHSASQEQPVFD
jgi:hypothetical protein